MAWAMKATEEYRRWFRALSDDEAEDVMAIVDVLRGEGPHLGFPHSSKIVGSRHANMRELRIQHAGRPYRVLYAFDPQRTAVLLLGGDKTGDDRWYEKQVPVADQLFDQHLWKLRHAGR